ncbi:MAG: FAD-dependent oxidoreductase [Pseudomonadota bacterium]
MTTPEVVRTPPAHVDAEAEVVIIGAGACGLTAGLRVTAAGGEPLILERDETPSGSTSLSSGFVPAPGTRFQRAIGVEDDASIFFDDLMAKSHGDSDPMLARLAAETIGPAVEWLADHASIEWLVLDDFLYPGHARHRMHATPEKTGAGLQARLLAAAEAANLAIATGAQAFRLHVDGRRITHIVARRSDGAEETIACRSLIFACNGFGGAADLVRQHIPEIAEGPYFGHPGNTGDALLWGKALDAATKHLSGYQGHGSVAHPHGVLITWALMMEGGIQVNAKGERFSNEHQGYSEQAVHVLAQPGGVAWNVYDQRLHDFAMESFPDYREADSLGAPRRAADVEQLARSIGAPTEALAKTLRRLQAPDQFGRKDFKILSAPFYALKVTGALFHTQGGLMIDANTRVLDQSGAPFENLFAAGGAACGVSGPDVSGYLSGNGLLTAIAFGWLAGEAAAKSN